MKTDFESEKDSEESRPPVKKRRRVPEACRVCRRRKAKCDGARPCFYCKSTNQDCVYDPSHPDIIPLEKGGNGSFTESGSVVKSIANSSRLIKNLQERVKFLESKVGSMSTPIEVSGASRAWNVVTPNLVQQRGPQDSNTLFIEFGAGVSTVNSGTRNIEFYGATSSYAFAAARALFQNNSSTPAKISALSPSQTSPGSSKPSPDQNVSNFMSIEDMPGMEELLVGNDTPMPDQFDGFNSSGPSFYDASFTLNDPFLQQREILDGHINSFFANAHTLFPILHEGAFRKLYGVFWKEVERKENCKDEGKIARDALDTGVMPLVFAVACHGALYSDDNDDQREWARGYFARARRCLSVFETGSFETMISMYLLHVFKINLAYNYLGLAIRLSYSIGIHVFDSGTSDKTIATAACWPGVSKPIMGEMAKRIWWSMYALEVESSLNCGRPMCIRNQDIYIGNPSLFDDDLVICSDVEIPSMMPRTRISYLIEMAKFSRIVRKVLKVSYSAESTKLTFPVWTEELHNLTLELAVTSLKVQITNVKDWKEALPLHLRTANADEFEEPFWMTRQRESIRYHYNHVVLTMYREFLNVKKPFSNPKLSSETGVQRCIDAARENIVLIRDCLVAYPSLRNWTHLYYYLLSASLVFIDRLNQAPFDQRALDYTRCCGLATEAFETMRPLGGTGNIISVIKKSLDEWKKRRDSRLPPSSPATKRQPDIVRSPTESESDDYDSESGRGRESLDSARIQDGASFIQFPYPTNPPVLPGFSQRKTRDDSSVYGQFIPFHPPDNMAQPFINPQFVPDLVSFNHGNGITVMPGSPYEPLTALLNSDIAQTSTTQIKVTNSTRVGNVIQGSGARQDDEEHGLGYGYNPSERIEKLFGINPMWK